MANGSGNDGGASVSHGPTSAAFDGPSKEGGGAAGASGSNGFKFPSVAPSTGHPQEDLMSVGSMEGSCKGGRGRSKVPTYDSRQAVGMN